MSVKQGKIPKGIQTTESQTVQTVKKSQSPKSANDFINAIISDNPKALPNKPEGSGRFLFDRTSSSEAPRNVYRETVHTTDGETEEFLWWHCENGNYIGRKEVIRVNPRTDEKYLQGYDYNIRASKENVKKVMDLVSSRTKFYKKYQTEVSSITKEQFL